MNLIDESHKISDRSFSSQAAQGGGASREVATQMEDYRKSKSASNSDATPGSQSSDKDILPSGKKVERLEDGYPVGGRLRTDNNWQAYKDRDQWNELQNRRDLSPKEKYAAGTMGLQLGRRIHDPIRDDKLMHENWADRSAAAKKTFDDWSHASKVLAGKLSPEQQKLANKVGDELQTELWQEQWRQKKFAPR